METFDNKPYKGPESYQAEDADLFFGREGEADQLTARILAARLTVLHAPSGAGKTSLLNARIIPNLEARGWVPVRILPQGHPAESVRVSTLQYVLPAPGSEVAALDRAVSQLAIRADDLTLDALLGLYDELEVSDQRRRTLIAPVESPRVESASVLPPFGLVTPYLCRLLRKSIEVETFAEHLRALEQGAGREGGEAPAVSGTTPLGELRRILARAELAAAHGELLSRLYVPVPGLRPFFENLFETYGGRLATFSLVLILDQFEELFTRFVDPGPLAPERSDELPDWRLRPLFFAELESLYRPGADGGELPIRYVVSLREEYIARLDPIRHFAPGLDDSSYHLSLLGVREAEEAIREPAHLYGYRYSEECYQAIIGQLTKEDRYVEPSHLQMVCEKLWRKRDAPAETGAAHDAVIGLDVLAAERGVQGILGSFLREFLEELSKTSESDRLETLELLEPLITESRTRNIVEQRNLVQAPFRDPAQRERLLAQLIDRRLVRREWRLGGFFVEITHEFLIEAILEEIRGEMARNPGYWRLRGALRALARFQTVDFRGAPLQLLRLEEFQTLDNSRDRIEWTPWATELMLRSALLHSSRRDVHKVWCERYRQSGSLPEAGELLAADASRQDERLLSLDELRAIDARRGEVKERHAERIMRSLLVTGTIAERGSIRYWTRRFVDGA